MTDRQEQFVSQDHFGSWKAYQKHRLDRRPKSFTRFKSAIDTIEVALHHAANGVCIHVTDIAYGGEWGDTIGLDARAARKLSTILAGLADAVDPEGHTKEATNV